MTRYAVMGSAGQLGRDLCARLPDEVIPLVRQDLDITNAAAIQPALAKTEANVVINCAAYNLVDKAEDEPEAAFAVNAFAIRHLAQACRELDITLVHFSTDYVYGADANRTTPWHESDPPGPVSVYGHSKLLGEHFVRSICPKHFVIRTCGLYGRWGTGGKGGNFVETMLKLAAQGKPLTIVHDQRCTPSYTVDVAAGTVQLLQTVKYGLYHLTNAGDCSWFEFANAIFGLADVQAVVKPITTKEFGRKAARPVYSVLTSEFKWTPKLRPWREGLSAYLQEKKMAGSA